ncbi:MAG: ABC transporter ATP-binding protein [Hyphomicrobiales bacterium]|nr:ABC transporter ATP-binding protein [Hyphomicrobiales bacterium]
MAVACQAFESQAPKCQVEALTKRYGTRAVVENVSFEIAEGEFVAVLGPSGCGKTTTLRLVAGLAAADGGRVLLGGKAVSDAASGLFVRPERRDIGMVFQSYAIWPHMDVFENVAYPLRVRKRGNAEIKQRVENVLALVGLAGEARRSAAQLSGGQMQRVALARALVFDPTLLLFDEPLSNLDLKLRERLRLELKELQRRTGLTSLYVTHDQAEAVELADRIIVMESGRVVQVGAPHELYRRPLSRFVAQFISSANIFPGRVLARLSDDCASVRTETGRELAATHDGSVATGDLVDVVIHPEDCLLGERAPDAPDSHHARIVSRRYQGTSTRYTVDWAGTPLEVVALGSEAPLAQDSPVVLTVPRERARIIGRSAIAASAP